MKNKYGAHSAMSRTALAPYSVWSAIFIVVPLFFVAYYAFTDNNFNFTFDNITRFFTATSTVTNEAGVQEEIRTYLVIFMRSLKLAVISTGICLLIGYPFAYIVARASDRTQKMMITLIMVPMWMNFLIRTYAWTLHPHVRPAEESQTDHRLRKRPGTNRLRP